MTDRDVDLINVQMMLINEPTFEGIKPEIGMNVRVQMSRFTTHDHISK